MVGAWGTSAYIAQNQNFERFGSKFGYAFIATPTENLPTFTLSLTDTAVYGATGAFRNLNYFDALLSIYFDAKHYFSVTLESPMAAMRIPMSKAKPIRPGLPGTFRTQELPRTVYHDGQVCGWPRKARFIKSAARRHRVGSVGGR